MILVEDHGEVTFLRLARGLAGWPLYWGGCYYVRGLLLDSGPPATVRDVLSFLESRPLEAVALTHHHEDHVGGAAALSARRGVVPRIHPLGVPLVEEGFAQEFYRRLVWGRAERTQVAPLGERLRAGSFDFLVLHTLGHSADHVCFYEPEREWLFAGDLFLAERLRYLRSDEDLALLIDSLDRASRLSARAVFCAHRGLVRGGTAALARKADTLRSLRERVQDGLRQGWSEAEITRRVVGREGWTSWLSLGRFSARNFVRAVSQEVVER